MMGSEVEKEAKGMYDLGKLVNLQERVKNAPLAYAVKDGEGKMKFIGVTEYQAINKCSFGDTIEPIRLLEEDK